MSEEALKKSAHDLSNLLTGIVNGIELLKQSLENPDETKKIISTLEKNSRRASDIINSYLKSDKENIDFINVPELIDEVISSFNEEEQNRISTSYEIELPKILSNSTDIFRIFHNLCKNALEATSQSGSVNITADTTSISENDFLRVDIVDTGEGIDEKNIPNIFLPKFSTKNKNRESGYGLSIVKEIIENLGGKIELKTDPDGKCFSLYFPIINKSNNSHFEILLAEDDESVSEVLADLLESHSYKVSLAVTGHEVLNLMKDKEFDLLLIDKKMPEMDGIECIKKIRETNQNLPIIMASGSQIDETESGLAELKINKIIKKPYQFPEILSAIEKLSI